MEIYSEYKVCEELRPKFKCIQVWKYFDGKYENLFHEHIPRHRINIDNSIALIRHLLAKFSEWNERTIIETYLNKRKGEPIITYSIQMPVEYPEPGVIRRYSNYKDINVWIDEVVDLREFRKNS